MYNQIIFEGKNFTKIIKKKYYDVEYFDTLLYLLYQYPNLIDIRLISFIYFVY
jgi:hypothetical protein